MINKYWNFNLTSTKILNGVHLVRKLKERKLKIITRIGNCNNFSNLNESSSRLGIKKWNIKILIVFLKIFSQLQEVPLCKFRIFTIYVLLFCHYFELYNRLFNSFAYLDEQKLKPLER